MIIIYQIKSCLQLNVYASLSRERIDLAWLNVLVGVWRSTKRFETWNFPRPWPSAFPNIERGWWTYIFCSGCSVIGCWEVSRCHAIPREMSALPRPTCLFYKRTGCKSIVLGVSDRSWCSLPRRHLFYLSQGLRVLFALKRSALVAYKPNWRFRYENILQSITRVGRYAMIHHVNTRLRWWAFTAVVVYAQDAQEESPSR